ncbi:MAG: hypothetical protein G01um101413_633 [Parcubacteria group bacterium Gr01-1014_13]|nr:MAG: hypothetical protein G01um101413_633 [Parcubacteria group bacterium Gr01-1014_13]
MENTFKKGLILGGLLAAMATLGFAMTKGGRELTDELQKDLKTLVKNLKKELNNLQDVTKETFDNLVTTIVDKYAEQKKLASDAKRKLITTLQAKWYEMEREYLAAKEEEKEKNR